MKKILLVFMLTLLVFSVACASNEVNEESKAQGSEDEEVTIKWGLFKNYSPVFIANHLGYFEDEGVKVDMTGTFTSGPAVVQAAASKELDGGHSALSGIINAVNSGVKIKAVADSQTEHENGKLMRWYVLEESDIKSPKDLKGKKIAVNSFAGSFYYTALIYLEKNGLSKDDVEFVQIPHHNSEQALRQGEVDVAGIIDPYSVATEKNGGVRTLFTAYDVLGENQFSAIFFTEEFIENHPEAIDKFLKAYNRAINYIYENPTDAAKIMAEEIDISEDLMGEHIYTENAQLIEEDIEFWMNEMRKYGELKDDGKLTAEDIISDKAVVKE